MLTITGPLTLAAADANSGVHKDGTGILTFLWKLLLVGKRLPGQ
jgi:hypothetical protein